MFDEERPKPEELILLRGGPLPDKYLPWRGGNEVSVAYVRDVFSPMAREAVGLRPHEYIRYRRSADDSRRFDFIEIY